MLRVAEEFHGSHTGRQRPANEDNLYARAPLFAVADGMGGAQAGEVASGIAVEALGSGVPDGSEAAEERLARLLRDANERIHELSRTDEKRAGMGTTMTAVLVGEADITIAHVGDSRAYRMREGQLDRLTDDHSLVEELVRQGKLTPQQASEHPQRSVITRALGPERRVEVDTQTYGARGGDLFLLCSDGLTTMVDEDLIAATLRDATALRDAGRALIDAANDAGGRDNITVVLFRLEEVGTGTGAAHVSEQETSAGDDALRTGDVHAALEAESRPVATLDRPGPSRTRRLDPVPPPPRDRPHGSARRRRALVLGGVLLFVGLPIALGVFAALRAVYFVGSDKQGFVTIYRGLPYDLPLGIDLYSTNYTSGLPRELVPEARADRVFNHEVRSKDDAYDLVRDLERGPAAAR